MVTERPILYTAEMVRAKLAGLKSMTRRLAGLKEINEAPDEWTLAEFDPYVHGLAVFTRGKEVRRVRSRYGVVGDDLWTKETWRPTFVHTDEAQVIVDYHANGDKRLLETPEGWKMPVAAVRGNVSPLLMPRWASRSLDEVTGLRIERLHDITPADILAEGVRIPVNQEGRPLLALNGKFPACDFMPKDRPHSEWTGDDFLRAEWASPWCGINGAESWDANVWVWVVGFEPAEVSNG